MFCVCDATCCARTSGSATTASNTATPITTPDCFLPGFLVIFPPLFLLFAFTGAHPLRPVRRVGLFLARCHSRHLAPPRFIRLCLSLTTCHSSLSSRLYGVRRLDAALPFVFAVALLLSPLRVPHPACPDAGRERCLRRVGFSPPDALTLSRAAMRRVIRFCLSLITGPLATHHCLTHTSAPPWDPCASRASQEGITPPAPQSSEQWRRWQTSPDRSRSRYRESLSSIASIPPRPPGQSRLPSL